MPPGRFSLTPSLRLRAAFAWVVIAVGLSSGLSVLAYQVTRQHLVEERQAAALDRAYLNARLVRNALRSPDPDVTGVLASLETNVSSTVMARVGGEWFSGSVGIGPEALPPSLSQAVSAGAAGHQRAVVNGRMHVVVGVPIPAVDTWYYEVVAMDDIERTLGGLAEGLVAGAALATLVAGGAGWYASGRVLRPLRKFTNAAERIAAGELATRLDTLDDRDLRALQRAFNRMAEAVQERIDREARFTSDVSHELRSPVVALLSSLNMARRAAGDPAAAERALGDMEERVTSLYRLVEDLLEISRVEAGVARLQLEPTDPVHLARAVVEMMDNGEVPVEAVGKVPREVPLDKRRVGQMLQNLIDNAARYAGGATRVEVAAGDGVVTFAVEDHGPGVSEHERSYIFERFARGEAAASTGASGTGLGLALVAEHAALHGGTVRLEDLPSGGSRFVIELPDQREP